MIYTLTTQIIRGKLHKLTFWKSVQSKSKNIKSAVIDFHQHAHGSGALERKITILCPTHTSSFKADCYAVTEITGPHTKSVCRV